MTQGLFATLNIIQISEIIDLCKEKEAIFFDMDGTVLNSEFLHFEAISRLTGYKSKYTIHDLYGMADVDVYPLIKEHTNLDINSFLNQKSLMMKDIIPTSNISDILLPQIPILIEELRRLNKKLALITASERDTTLALLKHCKLFDFFDVVITRQDTHKTKPDPAPYQHALKMLNITKENAIIFEDSPTGIAAGLASGVSVVRVKWYAQEEMTDE